MFEVSCMACAAVIFGWLGSRDIRRCSSVWHWRRLLQWMPIRGLGAALLLLLVVFSTPATNVALALSSALSVAEHQGKGADEFADGSRATLHERLT